MRVLSRVLRQDSWYMVSVRRLGEWHEVKEFVQPDNPDVIAIYRQIGADAWALYDWVCKNIAYRHDIGEFWQMPSETIASRQGDCEDSSILLTSLLRTFSNAYTILGSYGGSGHAWVSTRGGQVLETTYDRAAPVADPGSYRAYCFFNDREVIELWPGALDQVFELRRNEEQKVGLMARALKA